MKKRLVVGVMCVGFAAGALVDLCMIIFSDWPFSAARLVVWSTFIACVFGLTAFRLITPKLRDEGRCEEQVVSVHESASYYESLVIEQREY